MPGNASSSSQRKLDPQTSVYEEFLEDRRSDFQYMIFELTALNDLLESMCVCKLCGGKVTLFTKSLNGLAVNVHIKCNQCSYDQFSPNSKKECYDVEGEQKSLFDINIRSVYAMRCIGKGKTDLETFCGIMNLPPSTSKFRVITRVLTSAAERVCMKSMNDAVEEAVNENYGDRDIDAAFDGTWHKRGFSSLNGVVTATSVDTGKVIDVEIFSKFCKCPEKSSNIHEPQCGANYCGTSGGMEVEGVVNIFRRSVERYSVRYKNYLGDGDVKAFKSVIDEKPYGEGFQICKLECVGHVQKRIGTRLRTLKSKLKNTILTDGKPIGGRGRLTDGQINKIQRYYGMAIRNNSTDISRMKKAIWAIYFHLFSSDEKPLHGLCPDDDISWCKFRKARRSNKLYNHEEHNHLSKAVMDQLKPVFKSLTDDNLLKKCL
ncbi:MAG: hypothetical protein H9Q66_06055, partial [Spiroplasma ixodetis]|nr:hypothetical protein [Spiroplasma ixodetis]